MNPSLTSSPRVCQWIGVDPEGFIAARTGKSEIGQGIATALAQIVADVMQVPLERVRMIAPQTTESPDEGFTAGSMSVEHSGTALHAAARAAHALFAQAAARRMGAPVTQDAAGTFVSDRGRADFLDLIDQVDLDVDIASIDVGSSPASSGVVGRSEPRLDLPGKLLGAPAFLQDMRLPGMRYGRVIRPPFRGAQLVDIVDSQALPGDALVVRDGSFLGVIASREIHAIAAADALRERARWEGELPELTDRDMPEFLVAAPTESTVLAEGPDVAEATLSSRYTRPFIAHGSIGTACAIARADDHGIEVWSHTQGVYPLRRDIARALEVEEDSIVIRHVEGAGCYGHNGADDVAYDAVLLARHVPGVPVHVTWSRADELGWSPLAPAMVVDLSASTDASGAITGWTWDGYGNGHSSRPSTLPSPSLLAYADQERGQPIPPSGDPPLATGAGTGRNAIPAYRVGTLRATAHRLTTMPMRASAMRSLGAHMNVFAIESHIDELAHLHGEDPIAYRLRHLDDDRARHVIEAAAEMSGWGGDPGVDRGRGIGFARYKNAGAWCAVVADVVATDRVEVESLWIAVDCGRVVNPDGVINQIEGGAIQSASWTLLEQTRFEAGAVTSDNWEDYPIMRFPQVPTIHTRIVDRPGERWVGSGEASAGPTAAAIGNALRDALGIRVRDLPLTPERVIAALSE